MKETVLFICLLSVAFMHPAFSFGQEKPVRIVARQIGVSSYFYDVINLSQKAIKSFRLGYNYHQESNESELPIEPTAVESPTGWEGYPVFVEESEYLHIYWHKLTDDHFIQPGSAIGGFIVHLSEPYDLMKSATFTVIFSGGTRLAGIVEEIGNDMTPPSTSLFLNGTAGKDNWYSSNVKVTLNSVDSYSGVKEIRYVLDGAATTVSVSTENILVSSDGIHTLSYWAVDNAGNIEKTKTTEIKIDKTPPVIITSVSPSGNANGWNNTEVTVTFDCSDSISGIADCQSPLTANTNGEGQVISGSATDNVGHVSNTSVFLNIDKMPPVITLTGITDGATYTLGAVPVAGYLAVDNLSGMESYSSNLSGGNTNKVGTYKYTVTGTDRAGNTKTVVATYTVVYNFSGFLPPVSLSKPFKLGSTIPVKFQLTDTNGNYISTAIATIMLQKFSGSEPIGDPIVLSTSSADTGNTFRYSAVDNQYIYNLKTNGLSIGAWQISVKLDDGDVKTVFISLK